MRTRHVDGYARQTAFFELGEPVADVCGSTDHHPLAQSLLGFLIECGPCGVAVGKKDRRFVGRLVGGFTDDR